MMTVRSSEFESAFADMEGYEYLRDRLQGRGEHTITGVRQAIDRLKEKAKALDEEEPGEGEWMLETTFLSVYGQYGRRYHINAGTGEVFFSHTHAPPEDVEKAKALGFRTTSSC
jgi:hypothetical protein